MNIFSKAIHKLIPQLEGGREPVKGSKDAKIAAGHIKIQTFMEKGIINISPEPKPDRSGVRLYSNHQPKVKRKPRYFFRVGDLGYAGQPAKPVPYSRKAVEKARNR